MPFDDLGVREFLRRSMVTLVATRSRSGVPALTPLWFIELYGRIFTATGAATIAVRNLTADPRVALLFYAERAGDAERVLEVRGTATCRRGMPSLPQLLRLAGKYYLSPGGARCELMHRRLWRLRTRYYAQGEAAVIEVTPSAAQFVACPRG